MKTHIKIICVVYFVSSIVVFKNLFCHFFFNHFLFESLGYKKSMNNLNFKIRLNITPVKLRVKLPQNLHR